MHNPNSLTNDFDVIYLDHTVGSGLSTGKLEGGVDEVAHDIVAFLRAFMSHFDGRFRRDVYLWSSSFGGVLRPDCQPR